MKDSLKQMIREPWKMCMFILSIFISTVLLTIGSLLLFQTITSFNNAKKLFTTVGTVTQKADRIITDEIWDAGLKKTISLEIPVYNEFLLPEILNEIDIEYIIQPEQRPFYGAVFEDLIAFPQDDANNYAGKGTGILIGIIQPLNDCVTGDPVKVKIEKVLGGDCKDYEGQIVNFCAHHSEKRYALSKNEQYVTLLTVNFYAADQHENIDTYIEFVPNAVFEDQEMPWEIVEEDFFKGKNNKWISLANQMEKVSLHGVPISPTADTKLLIPFHEGNAQIIEGRDITSEEYKKGEKVCLISKNFARLNDIKIGDTFNIPFYYTCYNRSACDITTFDGGFFCTINATNGFDVKYLMNDNGEIYKSFLEEEYKVIGIYSYDQTYDELISGYALGANEIIIPEASINAQMKKNVVEVGPMKGFNTSFRIENGSIEEFMEKFFKLPESDRIEIQFFDNGYSQFKASMQRLHIIAVAFFAIGLALSISVITFFLYYLVLKKKRRTAIEYALGASKNKCILSFLCSIVCFAIISTELGAFVGINLSFEIQTKVFSESNHFSLEYTKGINGNEGEQIEANMPKKESVLIVTIVPLFEIFLVILLVTIMVLRNLSKTPMTILGNRQNE